MIKTEYQILSRKIEEGKKKTDGIQNSIDILSGDLTVDRQDLDEVKRKQGEINANLEAIIKKLNRIELDQKEAIRTEVSKAIEKEVLPLKNTMASFIKSGKLLIIREKYNIFTTMIRFFRGQKEELIKELQNEEVIK